MFFYRKGCWCPLGVDPEHEDLIIFEFCDNLLDSVKVDVALALVNREARGIALTWAQQQGFEATICKDDQRAVFAHSFSSKNDALYIGLDQWNKFCAEPYDRLGKPDLLNQHVTTSSRLRRLAIPEALFWKEIRDITDIFDWFWNIEALYIIMDTPKDLDSNLDAFKIQPRWELDTTQFGRFVYKREDNEFVFETGANGRNEGSSTRMRAALRVLAEGLVKNSVRVFEVYPAIAVRV